MEKPLPTVDENERLEALYRYIEWAGN